MPIYRFLLIFCLFVLAFAAGGPADAVEIYPVDDIRAGLHGEGLTVWEGATIESFEVEILGLLRDISPGRHLILAEAKGARAETNGVPGGISGSPVYVDGKLVGAIAYTWSFAERPLMGITPIEYMLDLMTREQASSGKADGATPTGVRRRLDLPPFHPSDIHALAEGAEPVFLEPLRRQLQPAAVPGLQPIPVGISVAGLSPAGVARLGASLDGLGLVPLSTGSPSTVDLEGADTSLRPGAAVGAALVRGDLRMDAFGTVTHAAGNHVLAFGHPFFGIGPVSFPMAEGWVHTVLPRRSSSFKMVGFVRDVGVVRQDRDPGLYGVVGEEPDMIPLDLELERGDGAVETHHFEVIRDPVYSPLLTWVSLQSLLSAAEKQGGPATIELLEDSSITVRDHGVLDLQNLFSGPAAASETAGAVASYMAWILNNDYETPHIDQVRLRMRYHEDLRTATVRQVRFGRGQARPGETVWMEVDLQPFQGPVVTRTLELALPEDLSPGEYTLAVGSAAAMDKLVSMPRGNVLGGLDDLLELIHGMRRNGVLYAQLSKKKDSLIVRGDFLSDLPPSMEALLRSGRVQGQASIYDRTSLVEDEFDTEFRLAGMQQTTLRIQED